MQQCRRRLMHCIRLACAVAAECPQQWASGGTGRFAATSVVATGRRTSVAPLHSLTALQPLQWQHAAAGACSSSAATATASASATAAACTGPGTLPPAPLRRLVHTVDPSVATAPAATAAARQPGTASASDEGLAAAALDAAQIVVASADGPAAAAAAAAQPAAAEPAAGTSSPAQGAATGPASAQSASAAPAAGATHAAAAADAGSDETHQSRWPRRRFAALDWTPEVEADVLAFWARRGLLLPDGKIDSAATAGEQRRLRRRIARFVAKEPMHRNVPQLELRMQKWDAAKAEMGWAGDVNRTALMDNSILKRDPFLLLGKLQLVTDMFARHGIKATPASLMYLLSFRPATLEAAIPKFRDAVASWGIGVDPTFMLSRSPEIIQCGDFDIYAERIAALRSLHPKLDVGVVITKQPGTLKMRAETIQQRWHQLREAAGLDPDQMRQLVEYAGGILKRSPATIAHCLAEIRRFEEIRAAAGQPPPPGHKFPSWLMNAVAKPQHRLLRLRFLAEQAESGTPHALAKPALTIVDAPDASFDRWWPEYKPWCVRHLASRGDSDGNLPGTSSSSSINDGSLTSILGGGGSETSSSDRGVNGSAAIEHVDSNSSDDGSSSSDSDADR